MDTISGYSGKSYEKIVQKKDPGNRENGVHGARNGTAHSPKISGTCLSRCPFLFRTIVKRHAMTGSRLGRYVRSGQPPYFSGGGWGPGRENNEQPLGENLKTNYLKKSGGTNFQ